MTAKKKSRKPPVRGKSAASARAPARGVEAPRPDAIERAKLEWEGTVDALASLVCLLDRGGRVLRANRVVEDWSIGKVRDVIGMQAHALLHPHCTDARCDLSAFLSNAVRDIAAGGRKPFDVDALLPPLRDVKVTVMPMRFPAMDRLGTSETLAVLVADDVSALYKAQDALERLNVSLEGRVRSRTKALALSNQDLRKEVLRREVAETQLRTSRDELAALSSQLIRTQEGERKLIAQELHDSVGQSLSSVKYTIERALELLRRSGQSEKESVQVLELAVKRVQETAESIRTISSNLRPAVLDDLGAASALQWFCREFAETYSNLVVATVIAAGNDEVPERLATVVYRCLQEMLNNVAKHSKARSVLVRLALNGDSLLLQVIDDGVGIKAVRGAAKRGGSGLRNLRERAKMSGGTFSITSEGTGGTRAQLKWLLGADERTSSRPGEHGEES